MRRAKMMLKPKLGPSVKQNQPPQVQPQTSKAIEHAAQSNAPPETNLMPPPTAPPPPPQESGDQPKVPEHDKSSQSADVTQITVAVPRVQADTSKETSLCRELVPSNSGSQKTSVGGKPKPAKGNLELETAASLPARRERKPTKKADEFREMLMASRRRFGKVREPIDTSKLTMLDLIYYNPPGAPMKKKATEATKAVEKLEQQSLEPELEEESNAADSTKGETEDEVMGPRVVVGPDGEITIDETSLVIRRPNPLDSKHKLKVTVEEAGKARYNSFKTRKMKKCTWTTKETSKFYQALSICGTDFTLMTQFFPSRSRQDLKNKFKREEKSNSALIDKAIHHPTQFEYTDFEMEDIAKDDNEPQRTKSTRSGAKGSKKRKAKTVDSVEEELLALTDKPANEKYPTLRVSRPKRNRARVDYAGLNESPQVPEEPSPNSHEAEVDPDRTQTGGGASKPQEASSDPVAATSHTLTLAPSEELVSIGSPIRMDSEPQEAFEVPSEGIDEVSQITEQIQPQEPPVEDLEISEEKIVAPKPEKPAEPVPKPSARKIPAPVFKPRHRKAALRPAEVKKPTAQKTLPSVVDTKPQKLNESTPHEEESSGMGSPDMDMSLSSSAELKESSADTTDASKSPSSTACPVGSGEIDSERVGTPSPSARVGSWSTSAKSLVSSPTGPKVDTRAKDVSSDDTERLERKFEGPKSATLPKLVLPSRPISNRIIRPIGAAKTRGVVLSPVTRRRSEPAKKDE